MEITPVPRWPGHMLSENTFVIFTSDNGGSAKYTDNTPLDLGKSSAKEGGTRVHLLIAGPGIPAGVETDVLANGLDFYPTILSLTDSKWPEGKHLDGCDLAPLLLGDPTNPAQVKHADGSIRETTMWHFPHGNDLQSTIIVGGYKLIQNYNHRVVDGHPELELYQLYKAVNGKPQRVDIEESMNLVGAIPEKTRQLKQMLSGLLEEMDANFPSYNPECSPALPNQEFCPVVAKVETLGDTVRVEYKERGAKVERAHLIYTLNAGDKYEEWFRVTMKLTGKDSHTGQLPKGATHFFINLIDENQFLVSHPSLNDHRREKQLTQLGM